MDELLEMIAGQLVSAMLGGGPEIVAALLLFAILLLLERRRLLRDLRRRDERIDGIIDDYHEGIEATAQSLDSLKILIYQLRF